MHRRFYPALFKASLRANTQFTSSVGRRYTANDAGISDMSFDSEFLFGKDSINYFDMKIHPEICSSLQKHGKSKATRVQVKAFDVILNGNDTLITAETGSGKTISYLLPLLQLFIVDHQNQTSEEVDIKRSYPKGIILAPNR